MALADVLMLYNHINKQRKNSLTFLKQFLACAHNPSLIHSYSIERESTRFFVALQQYTPVVINAEQYRLDERAIKLRFLPVVIMRVRQ